MKKIIFTLCLITAQSFYSQMAVTDVGATSQLAQSVTTATKSLSQLNNTYKVLKEANDKIQNVNNAVQQANHLQSIINSQKESIKYANEILKMSKTKKINLGSVDNSIKRINGSINSVRALLQNGLFNMNDAERLNRLDKEMEKVNEENTNIKIIYARSKFR